MKFLRANLGDELAAVVVSMFIAILGGVGLAAMLKSFAPIHTCHESAREVPETDGIFCDSDAKLSLEVRDGRTYAKCTCPTETP